MGARTAESEETAVKTNAKSADLAVRDPVGELLLASWLAGKRLPN